MSRWFADSIDSVVAADAIAGDVVVIEVCGHPGNARMAVVACVPAIYMVCRLAIDYRVVVAAHADTENLCVINDGNRRKSRRRMAVFAEVRRSNVSNVLTGCAYAIVAADAAPDDSEMIEEDRKPSGRSVA